MSEWGIRYLCVDKKMAEIIHIVSMKLEYFEVLKNFP